MKKSEFEKFRNELRELLQKYDVSMAFGINWAMSSPTVYADGLYIKNKDGKEIRITDGWEELTADSLKQLRLEEVEGLEEEEEKDNKKKRINQSPIM